VSEGTTYELVGLVWSGTYLEVHTKISGKLIDQLLAATIQAYPSPVVFPGMFLITPKGTLEIPIAVLNQRSVRDRLYGDHVLDEVRVFKAAAAGSYRIVVATDPTASPLATWTVSVR
jgi:hypothetical protein